MCTEECLADVCNQGTLPMLYTDCFSTCSCIPFSIALAATKFQENWTKNKTFKLQLQHREITNRFLKEI